MGAVFCPRQRERLASASSTVAFIIEGCRGGSSVKEGRHCRELVGAGDVGAAPSRQFQPPGAGLKRGHVLSAPQPMPPVIVKTA